MSADSRQASDPSATSSSVRRQCLERGVVVRVWARGAGASACVFLVVIFVLGISLPYCACANSCPAPFVFQATSWVKTVKPRFLCNLTYWCWILVLRLILNNIYDSFVTKCVYGCSATRIFVVMFTKWNNDIMTKPARPPLDLGEALTRNRITTWSGPTESYKLKKLRLTLIQSLNFALSVVH